MEDKEYNKCMREFKKFVKKDRIGKIVFNELDSCLKRIFLEGYKLGAEFQALPNVKKNCKGVKNK